MDEGFEADREETLCQSITLQIEAALTNAETVYTSERAGLMAKLLGVKAPPYRRKAARHLRDALDALGERPAPPGPEIPYPPTTAEPRPGELRPLRPLRPLREPNEFP